MNTDLSELLERQKVADALEEFAMIDEAEGGNPLVIATERHAAELLRSPQPAGVRVKRLEWSSPLHGSDLAGGCYSEAQSIFGTYQAWGSGMWSSPTGKYGRHDGNLASGQAAAEADYRQRILSAIEPQKEEAVAQPFMWIVQWEWKKDPGQKIAGGGTSYSRTEAAADAEVARLKTAPQLEWAKKVPLYAHPTPVQVQESQTVSERMVTLPRDQVEFVLEALTETRSASIAGCKSDGYSNPQLWADRLYRSHGGLTASIKTLTAALETSHVKG